ncbi:MAG: shikimate kinase [Saprospiraceae bacterium]|nr:shikimate kinase [Saprospiraceae bacterium]
MPSIVFLLGFMGSGKTHWGKRLADHLDWSFTDLDQHIEQQENMSVASLFENHGEAGFRRIERYYLNNFAIHRNLVLACGGGTACFLDNMDWMLRQGFTVYLKATPEFLKQRLETETAHRPLLNGLEGEALLEFIKFKLEERKPCYERAHLTIEVESATEELLLPKLEQAIKT